MDKYDYKGLSGKVITPDDPAYEEARQEWNRAIQKYPLAIVYCYQNSDISNAILWARKHCVGIRIRSGGHNYAGYSTGNDVLLIDVSKMNEISLNERRNTVTAQGGVNNGQLYEYLGERGYPFPSGTCPTVGLSGIMLGGGWGYSCRLFGLVCDSLLELELVNYRGELLVANEHKNTDLYWACRGAGGGNFGVVTSMTFRLPPKVDKVTFFEMRSPDTSSETQAAFLDTWQNTLVGLDERLGMQASVNNSLEEGMYAAGRGLFYGPPEEALALLAPFTRIEGLSINLQYMTFLEAVEKIGASYPSSEMFKNGAGYVYRAFTAQELQNIVSLIQERANGSVFAGISVYALGGQVSAISSEETAYYYRNAHYIILIQSVWTDPAYANENTRWVERKFKYLQALTEGAYINFPYSELKQYELAYFGANVPRLSCIKEKYDPLHVFAFPQGIRPGNC